MGFDFKTKDKGVCDTCKHLKQDFKIFKCKKNGFDIGESPCFTTCDLYEYIDNRRARVNFREVATVK